MLSFTTLVIATVVVGSLYYFFNNGNTHKGPGKQLSGPLGLPLIGSLLSIGLKPHRTFAEWIPFYGRMFRVNLGLYKFVIINDLQIAREAYNEPALNGRPPFEVFNLSSAGGKYGISSTQGHVWTEQRRFSLRHLRDFGFGKASLQTLIMDEVTEFVDWLKSQEGTSITLNRKFTLAIVNSLWQIMTGKRFKQTDPELNAFMSAMNDTFSDAIVSPIALFYPKLAKALPKWSGWGELEQLVAKLNSFTAKPVNEHLQEYAPSETPRDFIDSYIQEIRKTTDPKSTFYKETGEKSLEVVVGDLFGAGANTTSLTLSWAILYITKFPNTLKKMQEELDSAVGHQRSVALEDRPNLPYSEAVILETLRKSTIAPFGLIHSAMETTTVSGYTIPKDSWIMVNQHFIHHDPEIWGDPETFRPERFLSSDGKTTVKNEAMVAFAVGKRKCIGETIAKDTLFLFLTNIVKQFSIEFDRNLPEPTLEPIPGFFSQSALYNVIMKDRTV